MHHQACMLQRGGWWCSSRMVMTCSSRSCVWCSTNIFKLNDPSEFWKPVSQVRVLLFNLSCNRNPNSVALSQCRNKQSNAWPQHWQLLWEFVLNCEAQTLEVMSTSPFFSPPLPASSILLHHPHSSRTEQQRIKHKTSRGERHRDITRK